MSQSQTAFSIEPPEEKNIPSRKNEEKGTSKLSKNKESEGHRKLKRFVYLIGSSTLQLSISKGMSHKEKQEFAAFLEHPEFHHKQDFDLVNSFLKQLDDASQEKYDALLQKEGGLLFLFSYLIVLSIRGEASAIGDIYKALSPINRKVIDAFCKPSTAYDSCDALLLKPLDSTSIVNYGQVLTLGIMITGVESPKFLGDFEAADLEISKQRHNLFIDLELDNLSPLSAAVAAKDKFTRARDAILRLGDGSAPTRNEALEKMWLLLNTFRRYRSNPDNVINKSKFTNANTAYTQFAERLLSWEISPRGYRRAGYLMLAAGVALTVLCGLSAGAAIGFGIGAVGAFALAAVFFKASKNAVPRYAALQAAHDACNALLDKREPSPGGSVVPKT